MKTKIGIGPGGGPPHRPRPSTILKEGIHEQESRSVTKIGNMN